MTSKEFTAAFKQDIRSLSGNKTPPGITAFPVGDSQLNWQALISGPRDTVFEGGLFRVSIELSPEYPREAPSVTFLTQMYHPNVYRYGSVCMDILDRHWKDNYRIRDVLLTLQALLDDPNPNSPANSNARDDFLKHPVDNTYRKKVAEIVKRSESMQRREGEAANVNYNKVQDEDESSCCIQ